MTPPLPLAGMPPTTVVGVPAEAQPPHRLDPAALGDHVDRLFRAAWAMCGSPHDAEDLVQETYVRVLARPRFLRRGDDLAYLLQTLRNVHVSRHRAAGARPDELLSDDLDHHEDPRTAWRPDVALDAGELFAAIAALPDPFRDALVAVDLVGLSYAEAARAVGTTEPTLTTRLHRARRRVARRLAPAAHPEAVREA
ncbi:RNA polymerase sigma factor [Conexibacter sp. SYSU D00693]|uniref:RNA polymerase sigma factor n=1 Tax=Conexibacter sp. SYSU D00693 TaxID=2812560 RepID=UPI00196ADBF5|nr:RNA polymerase sigma factor [Conexibacter sp. SYSU D00693]